MAAGGFDLREKQFNEVIIKSEGLGRRYVALILWVDKVPRPDYKITSLNQAL